MRTIVLSLLIMVCQQTLMAQTEPTAAFLWRVNINGSEFNLAGSVHTGKIGLSLPETYLNAYKQADIIIFELKDNSKTLKEMIFKYAEKDTLAEDQYLDKYLSQESRDMLSELFIGKEDILSRYFHHEGWLLNMAISGMKSRLIGYEPELSVDMYFHDMATKDKKEIVGLDQIETQLKLFDFEVPLETQVQIIESAIHRAEQQALSEQSLFDTYYSQDPEAFREAFYEMMDFENPQKRSMYDKVFVKRNMAWVKKLIELSETRPGVYFMVVGSGHYFGPDNLIELLKKEEYQVVPYNSL
jgi:uncharacterized protein YbaP (TraB family)